ncbi:unnamed protein product [Lactuca saligna]|uniref:Uncharacterized protein n=1 Tax=Lactuca saligna TaxID=75948 RepID=A0AA35VGI3_LACSI|nr:unnamed protein product [Lactuca saligna]
MLSRISASSNILQEYRKRPSAGPRELTQAMVRSIEEADKPAKRGKKPETQRGEQVSKKTKGQTPKKRKTNKPVPSQVQPKKQKKPARRLILQSSSDPEYVPPKHKSASPSESESESSEEEASGRVVTEHSTSLSDAAKAIATSTSQCQQASTAGVAAKNAKLVNASVKNLQKSIQAERSNFEAARLAIQQANKKLHDNVNDRLT